MRQEITDTLEFVLGSRDTVLALWLEGADANATVDEYSDLDFCCAVMPGYMDEIEELTRDVLSSFDVLDQNYIIVDENEVVWQSVRVEKYLIRGNLIEAFGYYQKYILYPLLEILGMRYPPLHTDYGIVHISKDFPQAIVRQVEKLYVFSSLDDLESNCREALSWYYETKIELLA
jgi:hypothetical protein